ncbi:MAG: hypothetical protein WCW16_03185 [Candidatus Magasanikbacteria bacterium]
MNPYTLALSGLFGLLAVFMYFMPVIFERQWEFLLPWRWSGMPYMYRLLGKLVLASLAIGLVLHFLAIFIDIPPVITSSQNPPVF